MSAEGEGAWRGFGGPEGNFQVPGATLHGTWPEDGPGEIWSRDLGGGYAGILVEDGRLYTAYRKGDEDVVVALDEATGKTVWEHAYPDSPLEGQVTDFGVGPNSTPLIHEGRLFTVSFSGKMLSLEKDSGKLAWSRDLLGDFKGSPHRFGYSSAPIAHDGMIFVLVGGESTGVVGLDPKDGTVRWQSEALGISYATPRVLPVAGEQQLVFMTPTEVVGVGLDDGKVRWRHGHVNQFKNNCMGPWLSEDGLLFLSSQGDAGSQTLKVERKGDGFEARQVTSNPKFKIFHNSAVLVGDHVYGASGSVLTAHNFRTGENAWQERGYPKANVLLATDKLILLDETGKLSLATANAKGLEVHASHDVLSKPAWTPPTLVGDRLYARDTQRIVALDLGKPSPASASPASAVPATDKSR